jgi:hypothetical protein
MLCISATHHGFSTGQQAFKKVACHHRGEAIKLLSELLQNGKDSVSDLVIAAAGCRDSKFYIEMTRANSCSLALAHHDVRFAYLYLV